MTNNKLRLDADEYAHHAPEEPGTVHIHHCKQGHGNDRLYITRKEDGTILAYCHHCHASGSVSPLAGVRAIQGRKKTGVLKNTTGILSPGNLGNSSGADNDGLSGGGGDPGGISCLTPKGLIPANETGDFKAWSPDAKRWWLECGLTIPEQQKFGVTYDTDQDQIVMRIFGTKGKQRKPFRPNAPKYITEGSTDHAIFHKSGSPSDTVVLVEDLRSAYKLSRYCRVLPLMGTNLHDYHIKRLLGMHPAIKKVIVWLDNDNPTVRNHARTIRLRLSNMFNTSIITEQMDPKNCTEETILEILK